MATLEEIRLADKLALLAEEYGLKLNFKTRQILKRALKSGVFDRKELFEEISALAFKESLALKPVAQELLIATTGVAASEIDYHVASKKIFVGTNIVLKQAIELKSTDPANLIGGFLNEYIYDGLDQAQDRIKPHQIWSIETDSKACDYCVAQAMDYALSKKFRRHPNCRCVKVKVKP